MPKSARELLLIILAGICFTLPALWFSRDLTFRRDTDYDVFLPQAYFVNWAWHGDWGLWQENPYISTGLPVTGDPASLLYSLLFAVPVATLGVEAGFRIILILAAIISGISMWYFLTSLGIRGGWRIWGSLMYLSSGTLMAAFAAGHLIKLLAYPVVPLFLAAVIKPRMNLKKYLLAALVLGHIFFSGEFYTLWYLVIFFICLKIDAIVSGAQTWTRSIADLAITGGLFITVAGFKLFAFIFEVRPILARFFPINPQDGSIQAIFLPLLFINPWQVSFYDRPFLQRLIGFRFNWYEYYAFITPIPFIFLTKIKTVLGDPMVRKLLILVIVGALYLASGFWYSPFFWLVRLIPAIAVFRTPQRIVLPLTSVIIGLLMYLGQTTYRTQTQKFPLFWKSAALISIIWLFVIGARTIFGTFEPVRLNERQLVADLVSRDGNRDYTVASFICCIQADLIAQKIAILNMYYSWRPKTAPSFISPITNQNDYSALAEYHPKYLIAGDKDSFTQYGYKIFFQMADKIVWYTDKPNIFPKI